MYAKLCNEFWSLSQQLLQHMSFCSRHIAKLYERTHDDKSELLALLVSFGEDTQLKLDEANKRIERLERDLEQLASHASWVDIRTR